MRVAPLEWFVRWLGAALVVNGLAGCAPLPCRPGKRIACDCPEGEDGARTCMPDRQYGPCQCSADPKTVPAPPAEPPEVSVPPDVVGENAELQAAEPVLENLEPALREPATQLQ